MEAACLTTRLKRLLSSIVSPRFSLLTQLLNANYKDFPSAATVEVKTKEGRTASL